VIRRHQQEREAIQAASDRLFAGTPLRAKAGRLSISSLALEADVARTALTHRHTDLKDAFNARKKAQNSMPENEVSLRERIAELEEVNDALRGERDNWKAAAETFVRSIQVLQLERDRLVKQRSATVHRLARGGSPVG
jgi:hypothetical protein